MVRHSAQRLVAPVCIALLSLAAACRSPILGAPDATGTLTIVLPAASASRPASRAASRAPGGLASLAGTVTRWVLEGAGPGGHSDSWEFDAASMSAAGNTVSLELLVGDWTITIHGFDADGGEAFTATRSVTVAHDAENVVPMTLAWAESALVSRFSFDSAIHDDKSRLIATPGNLYSSDPVIAASSGLVAPALDGLSVAHIADADPDDYGAFIDIAAADGNGLELGPSFTVCMWACPSSDFATYEQVLMTSRSNAMASSPGFTLSSMNGQLTLSCSNGSTTGSTVQAGYVYDQWNHIAITVDGESGYASIYVNAVRNVDPVVISGIPSNLAIRIGARKTNSSFFVGSIDDLRIYAGALSAEEIAAIHADGYFSGGLGTEAEPYLVDTPMDLYNVRYFPAAHFRQTADIDLSANAMTSTWAPIVGPFTGTYDGGGRSVSNVALGAITKAGSGFFEQISIGGVVKNLTMNTMSASSSAENLGALAGIITSATISDITITGIDLTGTSYIGGLAGICTNGALTGVRVSGAIRATVPADPVQYIGGMAGTMSGTIEACTADVAIDCESGSYVGGFAGSLESGGPAITVTNCSSSGNISAGSYVGGFAGVTKLITNIDASHSTGSVHASGGTGGGFTGSASGSGIISQCYATGSVTGTRILGGFTGNISDTAKILQSYAIGSVTGSNVSLGGFAGIVLGGAIENCYARGDVTMNGSYVGVAGFAGKITYTGATVKWSYSSGTIKNGTGAFIGSTETNKTYNGSNSGCYWHTETAGTLGNPNSADTTGTVNGPSGSDLKAGTVLPNWDTNIWGDFSEGTYPTLAWEHE